MRQILRHPALTLALTLSTVADPSVGWAEPTAQRANESASERARELLLQGTDAINAGDFERARELIAQALQLVQSYDIAAALGQAELELELYRDAAEHLELSLRSFPPSESPKLKERLKQGLSKAKQHVATLYVEANPQGVEVLVDGVVAGVAPLGGPIFLTPGPHRLEARRSGETPMQQLIEAVAGKEHHVELQTTPAAEASSSSEAINTPASAAPPARAAMPPHDTDDDAKDDTDNNTEDHDRLIFVYAGAGLSLASLATGAIFAVRSNSRDNDANVLRNSIDSEFGESACAAPTTSNAADCQALDSALDDRRDNAQLSNIFLWTGVGFAAVSLASYLFWPQTTTTASARLQPVFSPNGSALTLSGSF